MQQDGRYRTLIFAKERDGTVNIIACGNNGIRVETEEYLDYIFLADETIEERTAEAEFTGRSGWIRRYADGRVDACLPDGMVITAFGEVHK